MKLPFDPQRNSRSAFTMVEIALSLAIIGFALVALIGVLPMGLTVQKENREETVIGNDAQVWMDLIRNGVRDASAESSGHLISYANIYTKFGSAGLRTNSIPPSALYPESTLNYFVFRDIISLISLPRLSTNVSGAYSNFVVINVRALTAPVVNLPPQDNPTILDSAFSYAMSVEITPHAAVPPAASPPASGALPAGYGTNFVTTLRENLHDVQLTFRWPLLPNGRTGSGKRVYRTTIGGQLKRVGTFTPPPGVVGWDSGNSELWLLQPNTYVRP